MKTFVQRCRTLIFAGAVYGLLSSVVNAADTIVIDRPMSPPGWALLERELLRANAAACKEFFAKYFDHRGWLLCVERWGGDDGPDDAIENCNDWPLLHALGAPDAVRTMYEKAWEGHVRQYTQVKTKDVPMARDGMYYKEFPVMIDTINAQARVINGRTMYPRMYGDQGWYGWTPQPYSEHALELWWLSMKLDDRRRLPADPWFDFLEGRNPTYPEQALRADLSRVRERALSAWTGTTAPLTSPL